MKLANGQAGTDKRTSTCTNTRSNVVTYDLTSIRAKVKQSKRARAAARRRLQLQRAAQQAAAAEAARAAALRAWDTEEARLAALPEDHANADQTSHNRRVHFSDTLTVTAIPSQHAETLPKAVESPARLADGPREEDMFAFGFSDIEDCDDDTNIASVHDPDDLEDPEDTEYKPVVLTTNHSINSAPDANTSSSSSKRRRNPPRRARVEPTPVVAKSSLSDSKSTTPNVETKTMPSPNGTATSAPVSMSSPGSGEKSKKKRRKEEKLELMSTETKEVQKEGSKRKGHDSKESKEAKVGVPRRENGKHASVASGSGEASGTPSKKRRASVDLSSEADDLDTIFSALKSKKARTSSGSSPSRDKKHTNKASPEKAGRSSDGTGAGSGTGSSSGANTSERRRRYTEEGYRIYTEAELVEQSNSAGLAGPCPFDCSCCH